MNDRNVGTRTLDLYRVKSEVKPLQPFSCLAFPFSHLPKTAVKQPIFGDVTSFVSVNGCNPHFLLTGFRHTPERDCFALSPGYAEQCRNEILWAQNWQNSMILIGSYAKSNAHPRVMQSKNAIKAAASALLWIHTRRFRAPLRTRLMGRYVD
jgi:hypothetical protein